MGKVINYFCDFCGKALDKDCYRSDGNKIQIKSETFCIDDNSIRNNFVKTLYLCNKDKIFLTKFLDNNLLEKE